MSFEQVQEAADFLKTKISTLPKYGIVCGSGLGGLANKVTDPTPIPYTEIPHFATSTVQGHKGRLVFGTLGGDKDVVCMQGRFHPFEGYQPQEVAFPIRVMKALGVGVVMVTCAAGSVNPEYKVGDVMIIKDHISFPVLGGYNPLRGPNDPRFGVRFPSLQNAYDKSLREQFHSCAKGLGFESFIREGILCNVFGPSYESTAELNLLKLAGGDCVSMSTIPEVIVARHSGLKVIGFTLICNVCVLGYEDDVHPNHEEVIEAANNRSKDLEVLVENFFSVMTS